MSPSEKQHRFRVALAFALVYVLGVGTYLGMRVAVEHISPYVMGSVRFLTSGTLMLAWCALSGRKIKITGHDAVRLITVGVLLISLANIGVAWAEKYVSSGLPALVVSLVPIWVALMEAFVFRTRPSPTLVLLGFALSITVMALLLSP